MAADPPLQSVVQKMIDAGESEENIATVIQHYHAQSEPAAPSAPVPVPRGGLLHPFTSVLNPELEQVRGAINSATAVPHGQPIMARSRTGALYPSETGTGAVNALKSFGGGAGNELVSQAEGSTSPLGLTAIGLSQMAGPLKRVGTGVYEAFRPSQILGDVAQTGTISPGRIGARMLMRGAKAMQAAPDITPAVQDVATAATAVPTRIEAPVISAADRARMVRQGYTPELIKEAEGALAGQPPPVRGSGWAPNSEPVRGPLSPIHVQPGTPAPPTGKPTVPRTMSDISPPSDFEALHDQIHGVDAPTIPNGGTLSPLTPSRLAVGAEKTGAPLGLSKEEVRNLTGSVRGEAAGTAKGMPTRPMDQIVEKLVQMGPKGQNLGEAAREAYAAAGTSEKTRLQVQAYLDALRKVGYAIPLVSPAVSHRQAMLSGLTAPTTDSQ